MIEIKGEYSVQLTIQNMFNTYTMVINEHNVVTDEGVELIFKCATQKNEEEYFGNIWVGYNNSNASSTDTINTFNNPKELPQAKTYTENNVLIYDLVCDGSLLDDTIEMGIWSNTEKTLITRSVHQEPYSMPNGSEIRIKYKLTMKNIGEE